MSIKRYNALHPAGIEYNSRTPLSEADIVRFVNGYSLRFFSLFGSEVNAGDLCAFEYTDAFSLTGWVKIDAGFDSGTLLARMGVDAGWRFRLDTAIPFLELIHDLGTLDRIFCRAPTPLNIAEWYFCGVTYDGSNVGSTGIKFYLNGALDGCTSFSESVTGTIIEPSINLMMGEDFTGWQDEIGIYNGVLSDTAMANLFVSKVPKHLKRFSLPAPSQLRHWWRMGDSFVDPDQIKDEVTGSYATIVGTTPRDVDVPVPFVPDPFLTNLTSYWKFDEGPWDSGNSTLVDSTGNYPLTWGGSPIPSGVALVDGFSASNGGALGYFQNTGAPMTDTTFSFQAWFKKTGGTTGAQGIFRLYGTGSVAQNWWFYAYIAASFNTLWIYKEAASISVSISPSTKYQLVVTAAPTGMLIYLNGVQVRTLPAYTAPLVQSKTYIAAGGVNTEKFNGPLDEMSLWASRVLTPAEITELYNGGSGRPIIL